MCFYMLSVIHKLEKNKPSKQDDLHFLCFYDVRYWFWQSVSLQFVFKIFMIEQQEKTLYSLMFLKIQNYNIKLQTP